MSRKNKNKYFFPLLETEQTVPFKRLLFLKLIGMFKIRCLRRHQAHKLLPKASNRCPPSNTPTVSTVSTGTSTASLPGESLRTVIQILLRGSHTLVFFLRGKYKIHFQCNSIAILNSSQLFCFTFSRKPFYVGSANSHEVSPPTHTLHHSGAPHAGHGAFSSHTAQRAPKDRGIHPPGPGALPLPPPPRVPPGLALTGGSAGCGVPPRRRPPPPPPPRRCRAG